ncbi:MAG: lysophospholipid acyltransferase family protein [Pseudomonadota bacterium]
MPRTSDGFGGWLRKASLGRWIAAHVGAAYVRLVNLTTRWDRLGSENYAKLLEPGTGVIATAWHGRLFMAPMWVPRGWRAVAMISRADDGQVIADLVARFGVVSVRGSTYDRAKGRDKGGAGAFAEAAQELAGRKIVMAITPDGPRGPRMRAQRGIAQLSIATGCPVQPIAFSARWGILLKSWDRFLVPFPFGRGVQIFGEPLWPPDTDDEPTVSGFLSEIEESLIDLTQRADVLCGRDPVAPR